MEYWHELVGPHVLRNGVAVHYRDFLELDEIADGETDEMFDIMVRSIEFVENNLWNLNTDIRAALRKQEEQATA